MLPSATDCEISPDKQIAPENVRGSSALDVQKVESVPSSIREEIQLSDKLFTPEQQR